VNAQHLRTFVWLRWRLRLNQFRRGGVVNAVLFGILCAGAVVLACTSLLACFVLGYVTLRQAAPAIVMYVWDAFVLAFLFFWAIGLLAELQRAEVLSLDKFLHLPVSPAGAFLINYLSSLFSLNLVIFVPAMLGLALGLLFGRGFSMVLLLPLLAAFLLMTTSLTYQFQGWLASLMVNKRRRRTIVVVVTALFILLCQLPNMLNFLKPASDLHADILARQRQKLTELNVRLGSGRITPAQFQEQQQQINEEAMKEIQASDRQMLQKIERAARWANAMIPVGWLALGAMASAEHRILPASLCTIGLALIAGISLWRSYQTTLRIYRGDFGTRKRRVPAPALAVAKPSAAFMEKQLPGLSQFASAITMACFRSLVRAPEAKMLLLTPVFMIVVFAAMFFRGALNVPEPIRPLIAFGGMGMILLGMSQLMGNQFGFDRGGFRVYVLCPAPRKDILLGKNLAAAPWAFGMGWLAAVLVEVLYPMHLLFFAALIPQLISMYLLVCLLMNCLSIMAPMPIAAGSLKPANPRLVPVLLHMLFVFIYPLIMAPTLLPMGAGLLAQQLGWSSGGLICLVLSLVECALIMLLYRFIVAAQGDWFHSRERKILEVVASRAE
jgi:hypothetical protein